MKNCVKRILHVLAVLVAVLMAYPALVSGQGPTVAWLKLHPATSPTARAAMTMAYDAAGKKVVLFGGFDATSYLNDTWVFDGSTWKQIVTRHAPSPRAGAAMAFDTGDGRIILFGGFDGSHYLGDTWIWDGAFETWTQATPSTLPDPVTLPMMFTDPITGKVGMFGGYDGSRYQLTTWSWSNRDWVRLHPATSPSARGAAIIATDFARKTVVLYGGLADVNPVNTWTWDGTNWTLQSPSTQPDTLFYAPAAFDPALGEVVLFGGNSDRNETWAWTGSDWISVPTLYAPPARESSAMVYDRDSKQLVLFGGQGAKGLLNDTYKLLTR